jgi:hypothetical protein
MQSINTNQNNPLSFNFPIINEFDLCVCYDAKNDKMVYRRDVGTVIKLPVVFTLTPYVIGLFQGHLTNKKFIELKKDILRTIRDDYKTGILNDKFNCSFTRMLQNDYRIYL